ncbi:MAG: glycosyltransferase family 4 protein [Bryobacteraceae bacterium]
MRIGVNALYLLPGQVGGTEIYLRSLLAALSQLDNENAYFVYTNRETGVDLAPPGFAIRPQSVRAAARPARIAWEQAILPLAAAGDCLDVLFNPGFTAPLLSPCPSVTVFHDLQHKRHPEHFRWWDLPFWRALLFQSACTSRALIAVSEATRADMLQYYPLPPSRVHTIPHGVDEHFFELPRRPQPYVLCVSTLHPHKNLERLIRAFAVLRRERPEYRLVIAGMRGFFAGRLEALIAPLGLANAVDLTGWIPRDRLYDLYSGASAFVYPSTFEGFGMPVVEALAAGIPTACSAIEPLASAVGGAALLFPPLEEGAIAESLSRLVSDEAVRDRLAAEGPRRARRFSWRAAAESTLRVFREAVAGR